MRRCAHPKWETVGILFKEPPANLRSMQNASEDVTLAMVYGMSTVTQRCTVCGWVTAENKPGRVLLP